jgi:tRNA A-37 threonylcarbamoyl transferase component Bud32/outer membrane protein assembly factor BamD (BamD/ComL family)
MATDHPTRIGDYDILGKLGKGGMASVYKAVQPSLNRIVAIKVMAEGLDDEEGRERFRREAQAVALLNHPNVVQIIDMSSAEGSPYFVMEYVEGTSLDAVMKRRRLSLVEALGVFKEVCKGLQAAHRQNVVHRDLNPRNILVSEDLAIVKLADFGISKVESISRAEGTLSTSNVAMGTLHYMAPEQASGMAGVDHRADIYSLGVLLYEMLTGRLPVGRFNLPSQLEQGVPPELDPLVLRCLSADPGDRYPTVDRVLEAVTKLEDQLRLSFAQDFKGLSRSTSKLLSRSTSTVRGRPLVWGAVLLAVVALGAVVAFAVRRSPAPEARAASLENGAPAPAGEAIAQEGESAVADTVTSPVAGPVGTVEAAERFRGTASVGSGLALGGVPLPTETGSPAESVAPGPAAAPRPAAPAPAATVEQPAPANAAAPPVELADLEAARRKAAAGLVDQALADFNRLVETAPPSIAAAALRGRAEIQEGAGQTEAAMASWIEFGSKFPGEAGADEAQFRLGKLLRSFGKARQEVARAAFTRLVERYPRSPFVPAALAHRAAIETENKLSVRDDVLGRQVPAALVSLRSLVERYPTDRAAENAAWELAGLYREMGLYAEAVAAYRTLGTSFPRTQLDAWFEAGQLLEDKLSDEKGAVAAYQRVPESSRSYSKAQKRIRKLSG